MKSFLALSAALTLSLTEAYPTYQGQIPNGGVVTDNQNDDWPGVGHMARGGGGPRNQFGLDFAAQGFVWTPALCAMDSDGDGLTNGQELGDPNCEWSEGDIPQFDAGITHPGQTSDQEVERVIETCDTFQMPPNTSAELSTFDLLMPGFHVPDKRTTYAKMGFNVYDLIEEQTGTAASLDHYGVKFNVINEHDHVVHHILLFGCDTEPTSMTCDSTDCPADTPIEHGGMPCTSLVYAWAVGGGPFCFPHEVGVRFPRDRDSAWFAMELHYDNPTSLTDVHDHSGVRISVVAPLAEANLEYIPAGFMLVGLAQHLAVPAGVTEHRMQSAAKHWNLPDSGVTVFAYATHAHVLGRKLWSTLHRKGHDGQYEYVHDAGCDMAYDFDLQTLVAFENSFQLYNDDVIVTNCIWDSTERTGTTYFGDATNSEMCLTALAYYPMVPQMPFHLNPSNPIPVEGDPHVCCHGATSGDGCTDNVCTDDNGDIAHSLERTLQANKDEWSSYPECIQGWLEFCMSDMDCLCCTPVGTDEVPCPAAFAAYLQSTLLFGLDGGRCHNKTSGDDAAKAAGIAARCETIHAGINDGTGKGRPVGAMVQLEKNGPMVEVLDHCLAKPEKKEKAGAGAAIGGAIGGVLALAGLAGLFMHLRSKRSTGQVAPDGIAKKGAETSAAPTTSAVDMTGNMGGNDPEAPTA